MFSSYLFLFAAVVLAKPVVHRMVDLDNNGVPDFCEDNGDGTSNCFENGSWTKVANVASTTSSPAPTSMPPTKLINKVTSISVPLSSQAVATGKSLPSPTQFKQDKGAKWSIDYVGDIAFTGPMAAKGLGGDKCRSSKLGDKIIWNCGDMQCGSSVWNCGFSMGTSFYGTDSVMVIDADNMDNIGENIFVQPWNNDPAPVAPQSAWGMDTSNVAALNDTHGVTYSWEIWRGASDGSYSDRGSAVALVTLGDTRPQAQRIGPLLTGPDSVQLGLLAIMRDGNYIYIYSAGGPSKLVVSRVAATDDAFDATKYESLKYGTSTWSQGIPKSSDTGYGMMTSNEGGAFGCGVYGSVFFNNYLNKYTIICSIFMSFVNMYTSDTPYGPWSSEYSLLSGWNGYGSMAHPEYSPGGSHKELYFSQGPNDKFNMFKLTFNY